MYYILLFTAPPFSSPNFDNLAKLSRSWSWQARACRADAGDDVSTACRGSIGLDHGNIGDDVLGVKGTAELLRLLKAARDGVGAESTETVVSIALPWVWCRLDGIQHGSVGWLLLVVLIPDQSRTLTGEHSWNPGVLVGNTPKSDADTSGIGHARSGDTVVGSGLDGELSWGSWSDHTDV